MFPSIFISVKFKQPPKAPPISVTLAGIVIDSKLRHAEKQYAGIDVILPKLFTVFNEELPKMDRVLCDVPCSGLGIIGKKPEIKYKKLDDTKPLLPIQKKILQTSSQYVKSGGRLVYSTCSVNPNENRKICDAFLKENPDFYSVKTLPHIERSVDEGDYLTLFPHKNNCDGFFVAVFQRR